GGDSRVSRCGWLGCGEGFVGCGHGRGLCVGGSFGGRRRCAGRIVLNCFGSRCGDSGSHSDGGCSDRGGSGACRVAGRRRRRIVASATCFGRSVIGPARGGRIVRRRGRGIPGAVVVVGGGIVAVDQRGKTVVGRRRVGFRHALGTLERQVRCNF